MGCGCSRKSQISPYEPTNQRSRFKIPSYSRNGLDRRFFRQDPFDSGEFEEITECSKQPQSARSNESYVHIEDTFWQGKKKLISDYSLMERMDRHVLQAPRELKQSQEKLIRFLIWPCKSDVEKARVITRWVCENIAYDAHYLNTGQRGDQSAEAVLRTGIAVCEGFGNVFMSLCKIAGLECRLIRGQAKNSDYNADCHNPKYLSKGPSPHAWNAVKLLDKWYLLDVTWAAGSCNQKERRYTYKKQWKEVWFLCDPQFFVLSHIPLDDDRIIAEDQFLDKPITDPKLWAECALVSTQAGVYGARAISHKNTIIEMSTAELTIQYGCQFPVKQWANISLCKGNTWYTGSAVDRDIALFTLTDKHIIHAKFSQPGTYDIKIVCSIENGHNSLKDTTDCLLHYRIINTGKAEHLPRGLSSEWGFTREFHEAGYSIIYPKTGILTVTRGVAVVQIKLPRSGFCSNMFHLIYTGAGKNKDLRLDSYVLAQRQGNLASYYVQCPFEGEYRLELYFPIKEKSDKLHCGAGFLIINNSFMKNRVYKINSNSSFLGINQHFIDVGLMSSAKSGILPVRNGIAILRVKKKKPSKVFAELQGTGICCVDLPDTLEKEESDNIVTFTVKTREEGIYVLKVFASSIPTASSGQCAAIYAICNGIKL